MQDIKTSRTMRYPPFGAFGKVIKVNYYPYRRRDPRDTERRPHQNGSSVNSSTPKSWNRAAPPSALATNLASALRVKNFKTLLDKLGEETLGVRLEMPLQRIKELAQGENFGDETAHHIEVTLGLRSGFIDQVNAELTDKEIEDIRDNKTAVHAEDPMPETEHFPESSTPTTAPESEVVVPLVKPSKSRVRLTPEVKEARKSNLALIASKPGGKSQLGRLLGLSPANISHRLHGNASVDDQEAQKICSQLGLPSGWLDTPKSAEDVPAELYALLSRATLEQGKPILADRPERPRIPLSTGIGSSTSGDQAKKGDGYSDSTRVISDLKAESGVTPISEALIKTIALKSRQGKLTDERALKILTELSSL